MKSVLILLVITLAQSLSINGEVSEEKKGPVQHDVENVIASLIERKNKTFCSAFFVSDVHLLTTMTCVKGKSEHDVRVAIYENEVLIKTFRPRKFFFHPNATENSYDLAIVWVYKALEKQATIFEKNPNPLNSIINKKGHFFNSLPQINMHLSDPIVASNECSGVSERQICVRSSQKLSKESIGGPLGVFYKNDTTEYYVGIYSRHQDSKGQSFLVFENTYDFYEWIYSIIS